MAYKEQVEVIKNFGEENQGIWANLVIVTRDDDDALAPSRAPAMNSPTSPRRNLNAPATPTESTRTDLLARAPVSLTLPSPSCVPCARPRSPCRAARYYSLVGF